MFDRVHLLRLWSEAQETRGQRGLLGDLQSIHGLGASLIAAGVSLAGIFAVAAFGGAVHRNSAYFSAFAVGLLTVSVLFHLILKALDLSHNALSWVAGGFALMVLIGMAVQAAVNRRADGAALTFGYASIIALSAHSFLDGVIYAAAFQSEPFTGWLAIGGLLFHEFPEGVIAFFLLTEAGLDRGRAGILAFCAAGLTTIGGTVAANLLLTMTDVLPMTAMFGGAAGALIYVLIVHLGPHAAKVPNGRGYAVAELGVIVGSIAVILHSLSGGH